jgi:PAS domain S-box-containing protein
MEKVKKAPSTSDSARVVAEFEGYAKITKDWAQKMAATPQFIGEVEMIEPIINQTSGMMVVSSPHRITYLNKNWQRFLGWTRDEMMSRDWEEFVHPEDLARSRQASREMSAGMALPPFVNRWMKKDGSWLTIAWTSTAYINGLCFAIAIPSPCAQCPLK